MDFILWVFYRVDWIIQLAIVAAIVAGLFLLAVRVFGWRRVRPVLYRAAGPIILVLAALGLVSRNRQQGYMDRIAEENDARQKASEFAADKRDEVGKLPPGELDKRFDRWSKK